LGGDELLRGEVDPVGERRDETRVGEPVVGEEPVRGDAAMEIVDGTAWPGSVKRPLMCPTACSTFARRSRCSRISPRLGRTTWKEGERP